MSARVHFNAHIFISFVVAAEWPLVHFPNKYNNVQWCQMLAIIYDCSWCWWWCGLSTTVFFNIQTMNLEVVDEAWIGCLIYVRSNDRWLSLIWCWLGLFDICRWGFHSINSLRLERNDGPSKNFEIWALSNCQTYFKSLRASLRLVCLRNNQPLHPTLQSTTTITPQTIEQADAPLTVSKAFKEERKKKHRDTDRYSHWY